MSEQMIELLPCPFCGHGDELQVSRIGAADEWWWEVFCDHCCPHGPTAQTEAGAIAAWNTRAAHSVMAGKVAELEKQRLMILATVYREAPKFVATICDQDLDRSGKLLGEVRALADAALAPHPEGME